MNKKDLNNIDCYIGQKLKYFRIFRGYTQEGLAVEVGLAFQQIQKYESGRNRLSASRIVQISKVLKISPALFFEGLEMISEAYPALPDDVLDHDILTILRKSDGMLEKARQELAVLARMFDPGRKNAIGVRPPPRN